MVQTLFVWRTVRKPPLGPGTAPYQKQVVGRIDPDDAEVPDRDPGVAVLAGFADALAGVGRVGVGAGGAGMPVHPLDAVAARSPLKPCRLTTPVKPRPLLVPMTSTVLIALKTSTVRV